MIGYSKKKAAIMPANIVLLLWVISKIFVTKTLRSNISNGESMINKRELYHHVFISPRPNSNARMIVMDGIDKNTYVSSLLVNSLFWEDFL
jgi:hypothetical protein